MSRRSRRERFKGANGTGTVYERPNGKYQGQVAFGRKADGTLRRLSKTFPTKNEATAWVRKQLVSIAEGAFQEPSRVTVIELLQHWQASNPQWSEASRNDNIRTLERHVMPIIGGMRVVEVTPHVVQQVVNELRLKPAAWPPRPKPKKNADGVLEVAPENDPLSEAMIRRVLARLRGLLNHGVRMQVVGKNAALGVRLPTVERKPRQVWTLEEAQAVVAHCLENPGLVENYLLVALATGLRVQELRGLPWSNVDLGGRVLTVQQVAVDGKGGVRLKAVPKSPAGYRTVDFDETAVIGFERQRQSGNGLVFGVGLQPLDRGVLRRAFHRIVAAAGVPVIRVYDTRATHGTLLAEAGVNPKVISERLGHADVAFSMRVYVRPGRVEHRAVAGVVGSLLQPAATGRDLTVDSEAQGDTRSTMGARTVTHRD